MNPNEKELLEKTYNLAKENNKILHGLRSSHRWSSFFHFLYWIIIIGAVVAAYYYAQPYINIIVKEYSSIQSSLNSVKSAANNLSNLSGSLK